MPKTISDTYTMFSPQNLRQSVFENFQGSGIDTYSSGPNQNEAMFLDLTNVMPAVSGGFRLRWGTSSVPGVVLPFHAIRMISYNGYQDLNDAANTQKTDLIIYTDNQFFDTYDVTSSGSSPVTSSLKLSIPTASYGQPLNFTSSGGSVYAAQSANWLYTSNGIDRPQKVNPTYFNKKTASNWGIASPIAGYTGSGFDPYSVIAFTAGVGTGYTSFPTVTITGGGGTGATAVAAFNSAGQVTGVFPSGPMQFNDGRTYTFAYKNSFTGHTSDIPSGTLKTNGTIDTTVVCPSCFLPSPSKGASGYLPPGIGYSSVSLLFILQQANLIDPQVDTLVILATSDGGSIENLYEVAQVPLFLGTGTSTTFEVNYTDTLPDTVADPINGTTYTGPTLLNQNIWAESDAYGNTYGIIGNQPPLNTAIKPVAHQGRFFSTDGKTIFFSKSLSEVTTSTGLVTSKWEESWPAQNQLSIALDNETINGIVSDGQTLHIGTSKNIYELQGNDPATFNIPNVLFQETGVMSQDLWSVTYSEGEPAGYMWVTPDLKIMYSDFSTYVEVGTPVYSLLSHWDAVFTRYASLHSMTYGPYNLCFVQFQPLNNQTEWLIYETRLKKWFRWTAFTAGYDSGYGSGNIISAGAVYQHPETGYKMYLFGYGPVVTGEGENTLAYFDPAQLSDADTAPIVWSAQTTWFAQDDPTAFKVVNELDVYTDDPALTVTLYGATSMADFSAPKLLKIGPLSQGPLGSLKFFTAGVPTKARYHSVAFTGNSANYTGYTPPVEVLTRFSVDGFPVARI